MERSYCTKSEETVPACLDPVLVLLFVFGQTDGGSEFEGCFAEFLQHDGSHHEVSAALSPWQNGVVERRGDMRKLAFEKLFLEHVPNSKADVEELRDHTTTAHNTLVRTVSVPVSMCLERMCSCQACC